MFSPRKFQLILHVLYVVAQQIPLYNNTPKKLKTKTYTHSKKYCHPICSRAKKNKEVTPHRVFRILCSFLRGRRSHDSIFYRAQTHKLKERTFLKTNLANSCHRMDRTQQQFWYMNSSVKLGPTFTVSDATVCNGHVELCVYSLSKRNAINQIAASPYILYSIGRSYRLNKNATSFPPQPSNQNFDIFARKTKKQTFNYHFH